jgi:hypothetical protein
MKSNRHKRETRQQQVWMLSAEGERKPSSVMVITTRRSADDDGSSPLEATEKAHMLPQPNQASSCISCNIHLEHLSGA